MVVLRINFLLFKSFVVILYWDINVASKKKMRVYHNAVYAVIFV